MDSNQIVVDKLEKLFSELVVILELNNDGDIDHPISEVKYIIHLLNQLKDNNYTASDAVMNEIKSIHKRIYPPRGGLSDFFIWKSDFDERVKANEPFEKISKELWEILQVE